MSFLSVQMLWLLLLVPLLVVGYLLMQRRRKRFAVRYASLSLIKDAMGRGPGVRRHIPPALFLVGLTIMLFALARPSATLRLPSQQGTIILTIDVSGSMRATDVNPTRLEAAKTAARAFVEAQPRNVRIGVVSFSNSASVVQAPTTNRDEVLAAINRLEPQSGTAIGRGIVTSIAAIFDESGIGAPIQTSDLGLPNREPTTPVLASETFSSAIVVLLSDGQSNQGPAPLDVVSEASSRGIRVYTVGLGSPTGAVVRIGGRSARVLLDEETLKRIAEATHGQYFKADTETDLRNIYEDLGRRLVFKAERTELTAAFTGAAAVVLLLGGTLSVLWFSRVL